MEGDKAVRTYEKNAKALQKRREDQRKKDGVKGVFGKKKSDK